MEDLFPDVFAAGNGATVDGIGGRELAVVFVQRFDLLGHFLE